VSKQENDHQRTLLLFAPRNVIIHQKNEDAPLQAMTIHRYDRILPEPSPSAEGIGGSMNEEEIVVGAATSTQPTTRSASNLDSQPILLPYYPLRHPLEYLSVILHIYRSSTAMMLGNMLEWLDFGIYGYSEHEISRALFANNVSAGWAAFGLGYLVRPLGAYVLGKLADNNGNGNSNSSSSMRRRHYSLLLAILGMAGSTACLSLLPAVCLDEEDESSSSSSSSSSLWSRYCVANVWSTAIPAILFRCIQGFSAGAAAGGVNVIQSEATATATASSFNSSNNGGSSQQQQQSQQSHSDAALAQSVGVNNVSGAAASLLSAGIVLGLRRWMGDSAYAAWGWRLAFWTVIPPSAIAAVFCLLRTSSSPSSLTHEREQDDNESSSSLVAPSLRRTCHEYELTTTQRTNHTRIHDDDSRNSEELFHDEPLATISSTTSTKTTQENHRPLDDDNPPTPPELSSDWLWLMVASIYIQFAISSYNNLNIYMVQYAKDKYHVSSETATLLALVGKAVQLLMTPIAAGLADVFGAFAVCAASGLGCAILAIPLMAMTTNATTAAAAAAPTTTNISATFHVWMVVVAGVLPMVSTLWISNAPLLATSIFPQRHRSQGTSLVMATGTALAGFFPLLLNQILQPLLMVDEGSTSEDTRSNPIAGSSSAGAYTCGVVLAMVAALAALAIFWIRRRAQTGAVIIYQRPQLF
jgi:hypothetical protein